MSSIGREISFKKPILKTGMQKLNTILPTVITGRAGANSIMMMPLFKQGLEEVNRAIRLDANFQKR